MRGQFYVALLVSLNLVIIIMMKIKILGSGAWEGIPAPFCSCNTCNLAKKYPLSRNNRTRPQLLIEGQGGQFLLEISPDIRMQSARFNVSSIDNFVISHWHFDHMYGLHELFSWMKKLSRKPVVHCSSGTREMVKKEFSYLPLTVNVLRPLESFILFGITSTPLPVYHIFARDNDVPEGSLQNTYAYLFESDGKQVAYLADYYQIPDVALEKLRGIDAVIADGTYLLTDQYKEAKGNHMHGEDIFRFINSLGAKAVYYHSISHLTDRTHEELQKAMPARHIVSYDGTEVVF